MPEQHTILGDKVYVYKRPNSSLWQCPTYLAGKFPYRQYSAECRMALAQISGRSTVDTVLRIYLMYSEWVATLDGHVNAHIQSSRRSLRRGVE